MAQHHRLVLFTTNVIQQIARTLILGSCNPSVWIVFHTGNPLLILLAHRAPQRTHAITASFVTIAFQPRQSLVFSVVVALPFFEGGYWNLALSFLSNTIRWPLNHTIVTGHFVRVLSQRAGHMSYPVGFCPLTDRYICYCIHIHQISINTEGALQLAYKQWQASRGIECNYDREHQTLTWLKCDRDERCRDRVRSLWCSVCKEYQQRISSMKNYSDAWITGSQNQRTSNLLDHVRSEQHKAVMLRHRAAQARATNEPVSSYSPIAQSLLTMEESEGSRMKRKFELSYMMAREGIAFEKFSVLQELESRHGVDLGFAYRNAPSAKLFTHYIAQAVW